MEAEAERSALRDGLELAPNAIAPGILHSVDGGVGRQAEPRTSPGILHHSPLPGELIRIGGVLQLAPTAGPEMRAGRLDPVGRRVEDPLGPREHPASPPFC